ncbi:hypothetical protein ECG_05163 [Echinococcus granulosus]|uniref:Uncharacterized protein n=1 Tax=Echinococcus granulosus TaxID=6210 RepID=A0A068WE83_ECHGR|nr:hypothetical protein ECG_05163 [Echinococcus granulosus]CDS18060.1 hypothetical protein EgrG_000580500 [Echinococcus granulosus]
MAEFEINVAVGRFDVDVECESEDVPAPTLHLPPPPFCVRAGVCHSTLLANYRFKLISASPSSYVPRATACRPHNISHHDGVLTQKVVGLA